MTGNVLVFKVMKAGNSKSMAPASGEGFYVASSHGQWQKSKRESTRERARKKGTNSSFYEEHTPMVTNSLPE